MSPTSSSGPRPRKWQREAKGTPRPKPAPLLGSLALGEAPGAACPLLEPPAGDGASASRSEVAVAFARARGEVDAERVRRNGRSNAVRPLDNHGRLVRITQLEITRPIEVLLPGET